MVFLWENTIILSVCLSLSLSLSPSQTYSFSLASLEGATVSSSFFPGGVSAEVVFGSSGEGFSSTNVLLLSSLPVC